MKTNKNANPFKNQSKEIIPAYMFSVMGGDVDFKVSCKSSTVFVRTKEASNSTWQTDGRYSVNEFMSAVQKHLDDVAGETELEKLFNAVCRVHYGWKSPGDEEFYN